MTFSIEVKKSKAVPLSQCRRQGGEEYGSYSFLTTAQDGVSGQRHALALLYPRERNPVPVGQEAGWASEARGRVLSNINSDGGRR
jgi:hypothetical protein